MKRFAVVVCLSLFALNFTFQSVQPARASSLAITYIQLATKSNTTGNYTVVDQSSYNGNSALEILVTNLWTGVYNSHPIGVFYISSTGHWAVFNEDGATMPIGAKFNLAAIAASSYDYTHVATSTNTSGNVTTLDNSFLNGNPRAGIVASMNWNPGGVCGCVYNPHQIGAYYNTGAGRWAIFNQDFAAIPLGAAFTVSITPSLGSSLQFLHTATIGTIAGNVTYINNSLTNGQPSIHLFVTPNWNPGGVCGCTYLNHPLGVYYDTGMSKWAIFTEDLSSFPVGTAFDVLALS